MKRIIPAIWFITSIVTGHAQNNEDNRTRLFDAGWRFIKDGSIQAYAPSFDDSKWRVINLPHDWSIEDLPNQSEGSVQGPFTKASAGKSATGFTEGGVGWYRKTFSLNKNDEAKQMYITFDGVYMDADAWINGHFLGNHPYGYTSFSFNLTDFLNPIGKANIIVVRVKNQGKNSRWYAGSGIYRHVWLTSVNEVHIETANNYIATPNVSEKEAQVRVESSVRNTSSQSKTVEVKIELLNPGGQVAVSKKQMLKIPAKDTLSLTHVLTVATPALWTLESPVLYKAKISLLADGQTIDQASTPFGIRSIRFDGQKGFLLNGKAVKLKGGCIHHDLGPLGAASLDRAEERRVELLKRAGYNALRLSHNPPSTALLNACDRQGMLVLDEAFDMWDNAKTPNDYHLYFKEWWQRDLQSMILRDRNHPSVIMWSIGNEIYEAPDSLGHRIAKQLADEVRRLDPTRPVTEAIIYLPPYTKKGWEDYEPHLANLDIDGYNYFLESQSIFFRRDSATAHRFETEHARHPQKVFMSTEYLPADALENWEKAEKYPFFMGGFKWTAMDYIGEAGIGRPLLVPQTMKLPKGLIGMGMFYKDAWPVFNAYCGDLDLIGNRKAASYYQAVVWRNSPVEMLVHRPIPDSMKEAAAPWGFPDELKSWTWPGQEGKKMQVNVYTRNKVVKLELNGKMIAEQEVPDGTITASFEIAYQPGTLIAKAFDGGKEAGSSALSTAGAPVAIRLVADRDTIKADINDLSYVNVEIIDERGILVPTVDDLEITYQLTGKATIAGVGNGNFADMSSFKQNHKKVFNGRGLVIVRPNGSKGVVALRAKARGLKDGMMQINMK